MDEAVNRQKFHPTSVPGITVGNAELGRLIARMRYDQVTEVLRGMSVELSDQAEADLLRGRPKLAQLLRDAKCMINNSNEIVGKIFRLSRPYMEHEFLEESDAKEAV